MAKKSLVLTDVASGIWVDECTIDSAEGISLGNTDNWAIRKRKLRGGNSDGVDVIEVNNGVLSVDVLPTRGMGLWRGTCDGLELGWKSPVTHPVHPRSVNLKERNGLGWLAGFNELLCRCGLAFNGPPGVDVVIDDNGNRSESEVTLHGRIANTPAHSVKAEITTDGGGILSVTGIVDEVMMFGPALSLKSTLSTVAGSTSLTVIDEITNRGDQPTELELLYHTNIGRPFLDPGAQFVAPIRQVAPRDPRAAEDATGYPSYAAPVAGYAEQVYYMELIEDLSGKTMTMLRNAGGNNGLSLRFSPQQLPCFALWKNTMAEADGYVTGLEPATNFPNLKTFERDKGRVIQLGPGETYKTEIEMTVHATAEEVARTEHTIAEIQGEASPTVHTTPIPDWSPAG